MAHPCGPAGEIPARPPTGRASEEPARGYGNRMKLLRSAAVLSVAKKAYTEARKPENEARIKAAVEKARSRRKPRS